MVIQQIVQTIKRWRAYCDIAWKSMADAVRGRRVAPLGSVFVVGILAASMAVSSCEREPALHLHRDNHIELELPLVELALSVYWDYYIGIDWQAQWFYGWDLVDSTVFGDEIGYTRPEVFNIRRYYLGKNPDAPHTTVLKNQVRGNSFTASYEFFYYDFLVWNEVQTIDGGQFLRIDEQTSLDYVTASTSEASASALSRSTKYPRAFNQPENLFSAYKKGIYISDNYDDYDAFDPETGIYYKYVDMMLVPVTYIYLTQLVLRNNNGRIDGALGTADLSGMALSCNLNTCVSGDQDITVHYECRYKPNRLVTADTVFTSTGRFFTFDKGERVDVIGGKCITFGIPGINPNKITSTDQFADNHPHYLGIPVTFNNGMDSTLIFDVSDQVRNRYKGGVITVVLDMDTVPIPSRSGGSAFNAVIADWDSVFHEIEM